MPNIEHALAGIRSDWAHAFMNIGEARNRGRFGYRVESAAQERSG